MSGQQEKLAIRVDGTEANSMQAAIISLCQAVTHAPNFGDYHEDVYWAMELVNRLNTATHDLKHDEG